MLQPNTIKATRGAKHSKKRVGRGNASGHGTSATRGGKGQTARSGGSVGLKRLGFKFQLQSTPKLRGFASIQTKPTEIYLSDLDEKFENGATVDLAALQAKNLVKANAKSAKVVSTGELSKKLIIVGLKATKTAAEKITKAGGEIK